MAVTHNFIPLETLLIILSIQIITSQTQIRLQITQKDLTK